MPESALEKDLQEGMLALEYTRSIDNGNIASRAGTIQPYDAAGKRRNEDTQVVYWVSSITVDFALALVECLLCTRSSVPSVMKDHILHFVATLNMPGIHPPPRGGCSCFY
jgi:hypothetical protein